MGLKMSSRRDLTEQDARRYRRAGKKEKGRILDQFVKSTGYKRKYAIHLLNRWGRTRVVRIDGKLVKLVVGRPRPAQRRVRPRRYDEKVLAALKPIWYVFDCMCGKRLVVVLRTMLPMLESFGEIELTAPVRGKLQTISAATIDRLLQHERARLRLKGRTHTKPGTLLKDQIAIRTFADWDEQEPGFFEIDLVGHEGGNASGDFCHTLTITDVDTGWVDLYGLKNKAQRWTHEAIDAARLSLPIVMQGIDTDNGSEFINHHLLRYCEAHGITFTRGRPHRKNDTCYVEQKNGHVVRRAVGYLRYDTDQELAALNAIYRPLCLLVNFFYPSMKLLEKTRTGSKVRRSYDDPQTPYHRMLASESVSNEVKNRLRQQYETLNPVALKRELTRLTEDLLQLNVSKAAAKATQSPSEEHDGNGRTAK